MCIFYGFIHTFKIGNLCERVLMNIMHKFHIRKNNFFIIKLKNWIIPMIFLVFTLCLVFFSNSNLSATKSGLQLWANSVVPSLLPFFIATELLCQTDIIKVLGILLNPIMKPLFNVRGEGSFALIMGIISGYPTGAKIASTFYLERNLL